MNETTGCVQDLRQWNYVVVQENGFHPDLGAYHTYGITVSGDDYEETLHDVSVYWETAVWMVELFNRHQLSPLHLLDAVQDFLP